MPESVQEMPYQGEKNMKLSEEISGFFVSCSSPVLFAGAGVSIKAGLPTWGDYLTQLANNIRREDELTALQMLEMVKAQEFLKAASYYFLTSKVRDSDKLDGLAAPLKKYDVSPLICLGKLPFSAYVTTNFDRVLADLYAHVYRRSALAAVEARSKTVFRRFETTA